MLFNRLARFSRLTMLDPWGCGASDPIHRDSPPTWDELTDDFRAVLDAAESDRAAIFATGVADPVAILFITMYPERVSALVLCNTSGRLMVADDYPIGV
jgi:pimeloyl-ACP methyl ester carboxylesterase